MKKTTKIIVGVTIGIIIVFIGVINYSTNKVYKQERTTTEQQKKVSDGVKNIEEIIDKGDLINENQMNTIENFIKQYKDEEMVKNDLINFIVDRSNKHLSSGLSAADETFHLNISDIIGTLNAVYPNNSKIAMVLSKLDNSNKDTTATANTGNTPNVSNKLTSDDGNLELESDYCSDGKVCGTIKNLSSDSYSYVEVNINLFDASGNQVDSILTNVNNLAGNTNWNFKAYVTNQNDVSKYKVVSIKGTRDNK